MRFGPSNQSQIPTVADSTSLGLAGFESELPRFYMDPFWPKPGVNNFRKLTDCVAR
jgi:hypothetical protein